LDGIPLKGDITRFWKMDEKQGNTANSGDGTDK
jgi:hypothetical protein